MSEMFSRPSKESHEGTIHYEAQMLRHCKDRLMTLKKSDPTVDQREMVVYLECFLLHYRNLAQFLSGKGGSSKDLRMTNSKKWSPRQLTREEAEQVTTPAVKTYDKYCHDISTYLSHCTRQRYEEEMSWKPKEMWRDIEPAINAFEKLFPRNEGRPGTVVIATSADAVSTATTTRYRGTR